MNNQESQPITLSGARTAIYFGGLLVAIVIAWGAMTTQQALTNQKLDTFIASADKQTDASNKRLERLETSDQQQNEKFGILQGKGFLSKAMPQSSKIPFTLIPTPAAESANLTPQPQQTIVNNYVQPTSSATPTPVQQAQPTPAPTTTPTLCVIGICL